jgi:hypothetical protein
MSTPAGDGNQYFLVEWYRRDLAQASLIETCAVLEGAAAHLRARGHRVSLRLTMAARADDVLFGVFNADSVASVRQVCRHAGWIPDRITADIRTHIASTHRITGAHGTICCDRRGPWSQCRHGQLGRPGDSDEVS